MASFPKKQVAVKVRLQGRGLGTGPGSFQMGEPGQTRLEERQAKQKAQVGWLKIPEEEGVARSKARGVGVAGTEDEEDNDHWVSEQTLGAKC